MKTEELISLIVDSAYQVKKTLGAGFLESVYQHALSVELQSSGITCELEKNINVYYKGQPVGFYRADLLVDSKVIVETKVTDNIALAHELQVVNYLKATGIENGIIINFGTYPLQIKRKFLHTK